MTALATNKLVNRYANQELSSVAVKDGAHIYKGAFVGKNASDDYARALVDGDAFMGIAYEEADNTSGADGAISCRVYNVGDFELALSSAVVDDIGSPVYASDDNVLTRTESGNSFIGKIVRIVNSGLVVVRIQPWMGFANTSGAEDFGATGIKADVIAESTSAAGVTVDGVLLKDAAVNVDTISEQTAAAGVTADGVLLKDGGVTAATGAVIAADADKLTAGGVILPQYVIVDYKVNSSAGAKGEFAFTCDRAYTFIGASLVYNIVSSGAAYLSIRKLTAAGTALADASAGATCVELQAAPTTEWDLTASAGTSRACTPSAVGGATSLASGDKIGFLYSAATTGLIGASVSIKLQCA